jgi:hypothetical protein
MQTPKQLRKIAIIVLAMVMGSLWFNSAVVLKSVPGFSNGATATAAQPGPTPETAAETVPPTTNKMRQLEDRRISSCLDANNSVAYHAYPYTEGFYQIVSLYLYYY